MRYKVVDNFNGETYAGAAQGLTLKSAVKRLNNLRKNKNVAQPTIVPAWSNWKWDKQRNTFCWDTILTQDEWDEIDRFKNS